MRIGQGLDVHAFCEGRPLILGGIQIPFELGLAGHSDADVVIHAICDALLGAAALGDIGQHFPDNDPAFKNIDSQILLTNVIQQLGDLNYRIVNMDVSIIAQQPKLLPHMADMRSNLANVMGIEVDTLNLKATTTEKLGFTGRKEGIAAMATVLIESVN